MLDRLLNVDLYSSAREALTEIRSSVTHSDKIDHLTHSLYRYPACFHPSFPRKVIEPFSKPGDWVLDPFVGGGTTAVEALAAGRNFVGSDINELAVFVSQLKTTLVNANDLSSLDTWSRHLNIDGSSRLPPSDETFFANVPEVVRAAIIKISTQIDALPGPTARRIARGALLRLGQLELEHRLTADSPAGVLRDFRKVLNTNIERSIALSAFVEFDRVSINPSVHVQSCDAAEAWAPRAWGPARDVKLVVTSPPYPERHILYHKWQVGGRAETRLPYWIIGSRQVEHEKFYTMGARENAMALEIYISTMYLVFENLNRVMRKHGVLVQMVAFNKVARQLPLYLAALNEAGFAEIRNIDPSSSDGRLWRTVPNRKWFNRHVQRAAHCEEVVLFHRKVRDI